MGPWTHKVDDGLETRKTAYETMYTLVRDRSRQMVCMCLTSLSLARYMSQ